MQVQVQAVRKRAARRRAARRRAGRVRPRGAGGTATTMVCATTGRAARSDAARFDTFVAAEASGETGAAAVGSVFAACGWSGTASGARFRPRATASDTTNVTTAATRTDASAPIRVGLCEVAVSRPFTARAADASAAPRARARPPWWRR